MCVYVYVKTSVQSSRILAASFMLEWHWFYK